MLLLINFVPPETLFLLKLGRASARPCLLGQRSFAARGWASPRVPQRAGFYFRGQSLWNGRVPDEAELRSAWTGEAPVAPL